MLIHPTIHPSTYLSIHPPSASSSILPSFHPFCSMYSFIHLSTHPSIHLFNHTFIHPTFCFSIRPSVHAGIHSLTHSFFSIAPVKFFHFLFSKFTLLQNIHACILKTSQQKHLRQWQQVPMDVLSQKSCPCSCNLFLFAKKEKAERCHTDQRAAGGRCHPITLKLF